MKRICWLGAIAAMAAGIGSGAFAIDRDASMIDSIEARYREYDQMEAFGVLVRGETQIDALQEWGLLAHVGWASAHIQPAGNLDIWQVGLGVRKYLTYCTSFSTGAEFEWIEGGKDFAVGGPMIALEYRFLPAESPLCPFLSLGAAYHAGKSTPWTLPSDNFSAILMRAEIGADVFVRDDVCLVVRAKLVESLGLSGGAYAQYADGWSASLGLKYYWR